MPEAKKVLVIGGGGREHALVAALARSPARPRLFCAPGNAGIAALADCVPIGCESAADLERLADFARDEGIHLTVVGPEAPLVLGIVDLFESRGLRAFGPPREGARLEGSKIYCKELLRRHEVPTADFESFDDPTAALAHVESRPLPLVVKADGLAAGKGVAVARDREQAVAAVRALMVEKRFGAAGNRIVVEDFLAGAEMSLMVLTDGVSYVPLETAQDYKPVFDGGEGPNTGGMGAYSPYISLGSPSVQRILQEIVRPTLEGLRAEGVRFRGVLYAGLMLTAEGPRVLEFNVRFGDPETQPILSRLKTDVLALFEAACVEDGLAQVALRWDPRPAVCVVAASAGYPGAYEKGKKIEGLDAAGVADPAGETFVYHAGTTRTGAGDYLTTAGRVLGVTALGADLEDARRRAYAALSAIRFEGMHFRRDVALRASPGSR
jgi:phosphoribosylamine--glycine ligase